MVQLTPYEISEGKRPVRLSGRRNLVTFSQLIRLMIEKAYQDKSKSIPQLLQELEDLARMTEIPKS